MHCPTCDDDNIPGEDLCQNCGMDLAGLHDEGALAGFLSIRTVLRVLHEV